jgi:hypothetical protein
MDPLPIMVGCGIGALNAMLTGTIFAYMLRSLIVTFTWIEGAKIVTSVLGISGFWWGGNWAGKTLLGDVKWGLVLPWYALALAILFIILTSIPVYRFIARIANEIRH